MQNVPNNTNNQDICERYSNTKIKIYPHILISSKISEMKKFDQLIMKFLKHIDNVFIY